MNIFAKRKRKLPPPEESATEEDKTFQSDEVVEELLKQDPSTWNAKQRRLVKRYKDRGPQPAKQTKQSENDQCSFQPLSEDSRIAVASFEDNAREEKVIKDEKQAVDAAIPLVESGSSTTTKTSLADDDKHVDSAKQQDDHEESTERTELHMDAELKEILDKLNSKQRRKLVRLLERDGDVEAVRAEATLQLTQCEEDNKPPETLPEPPTEKARKRGTSVDPSTLTPEERMRREEQRRVQQEAAKARVAGVTSLDGKPHKHPLNSERRRANRRKPKWEPKQSHHAPPNEHDLSGYHMRKITGGKSAKVT
jgi:hypothetical protein